MNSLSSPGTPGVDGRPLKRRRGRPAGSKSTPKEYRQEVEADSDGEDVASQTFKTEKVIKDTETGWMKLPHPAFGNETDVAAVCTSILSTLQKATDKKGTVLSKPFLTLPDRQQASKLFESISQPVALDTLEERVTSHFYTTVEEFDKDVTKMFDDARTWIFPGSPFFGNLLALRYLYNETTKMCATNTTISTVLDRLSTGTPSPGSAVSNQPTSPGGSTSTPVINAPPESQNNFIPFSPVTAIRTTVREKIFLESVNIKGQVLKVGDFVHLINVKDFPKPIIAQIFKIYRRVDSPQRYISVCWYYRPEETIHLSTRLFYHHEVFKSGNFVDHQVEEFVQRCLVMFYTKYVRGRPKPPIWYPGMVTYLCEHRYKDDCRFKKIKNWSSCIPEEVRKKEEDFEEYARPLQLSRIASPFTRGIEGPGRIGSGIGKEEEDQARYYANADALRDPTQIKYARKLKTGPKRQSIGPADGNSPGSQLSRSPQQPPRPTPTPTQLGAMQDTFQPLPSDIASKFKEGNNEVLWYPVPPMVAGPTLTDDFQRPLHSVQYLNYIAQGSKPVKRTTPRSLSLDDTLASILYTDTEHNFVERIENRAESGENNLDHAELQSIQEFIDSMRAGT